MIFRIRQLLGRIWWIGICGTEEKKAAFWFNLLHKGKIRKMEAPEVSHEDNEINILLEQRENGCKDDPLVSIIIVTYNNLRLNRNCIYSILHDTVEPSYEIIVVDNHSTDGTAEWLQSFSGSKRIRAFLNQENKGFAAANNQGMKEALGEYIVLLNNDTMVTECWLSRLYGHFQRNEHLGMCGPVTNSIGNEARIYTEQPEQYTKEHMGKSYSNVQALAFFCVMIAKETIQSCGLLDEAYGTGMFEDDDYAQAVQRAGYRLEIAEDAFVWHFESASFGKLANKEFRKLFMKNKKYYEAKWETKWRPHSLRKQRIIK